MSQEKIKKFLTPELCENAGIIVQDLTSESINIGAMNPEYTEVKKVIRKIKSDFHLNVDLKQITSIEWEKFFKDKLTKGKGSSQVKLINSTANEFKESIEYNSYNIDNSYKSNSGIIEEVSSINEPNIEINRKTYNQEIETYPNSTNSDESSDEDLDYESGKLANGLAKIGLSRGDRVSIQVDKCIEFISA